MAPVPTPPDEDKLANKRYATLILRLILDQRGHLLYGELVDATNGFHERFVKWRGLIHKLRGWFTSQRGTGTDDPLPPV
jgi:hypothetical protein